MTQSIWSEYYTLTQDGQLERHETLHQAEAWARCVTEEEGQLCSVLQTIQKRSAGLVAYTDPDTVNGVRRGVDYPASL